MCSRLTLTFLLLASCATLLVSAARLPRDTEGEAEVSPGPETQPDEPAATDEPQTEVPEKKPSEETKKGGYTNKFDNIDLDQILKSERLVSNYFKCLMDRGPCTPDATELKRVLPDALESDCSKCTEKQRQGSEKVIKHMIRNKPEQWKELQAKYDPNGKYDVKFKQFVKEHNIEE